MSYHLGFYGGDIPASAGYVALYADLQESLADEPAAAEPIAAFEGALLKRWPEKGGEAPWPAPIRDTGMGNWLYLAIRQSDIEDVGDELVELASEHGLIVLDPQERELIPPG